MTQLLVVYEKDAIVCDSDDHWEGRNLLHAALKDKAGHSRATRYQGNVTIEMRGEHIPVYHEIDAPQLHRRQYFSLESARRVASPVIAFLQANGVAVSEEQPDRKAPWTSGDLVHVFSNGSFCDPHASDLPNIVLLPKMARHVWNLVRYPEEAPRF